MIVVWYVVFMLLLVNVLLFVVWIIFLLLVDLVKVDFYVFDIVISLLYGFSFVVVFVFIGFLVL